MMKVVSILSTNKTYCDGVKDSLDPIVGSSSSCKISMLAYSLADIIPFPRSTQVQNLAKLKIFKIFHLRI